MNDWDKIYGDAPASFEKRILCTLENLPQEEKKPIRRLHRPFTGLIAAAMAVVVLAGTAFATNFFGLGSLRVEDPFAAPEAVSESESEYAPDSIALQGTPESPEYLATAEWMAFLTGYDTDRSKLEAVGNSTTGLEEDYGLYFVYTQEMADKLDEIVEKYDLTLHSSIEFFDSADGLYSLIGSGAFIGSTPVSGYAYEDGSFLFAADSSVPTGSAVSPAFSTFSYEFNRHVKGSFSEVTLNVGRADDYEGWEYTTRSGVTVNLFMSGEKCLLLANLPTAFISVNILGGSEGNSLYMSDAVTKESLEAFADLFDFSLLG